ncbi:MAG: glycosyltransferase family 9 protein [Planctomycetota bacterium]
MSQRNRQDGVGRPRERILVVCTRYIGDTVLAIPFLRNLRRTHPHAVIDVLAERAARAVLADCPHLDELVAWERPRGGRLASARALWSTAGWLRSRRYSRVYLLKRSTSGALLAWLAGIPHRVGFAGEGCRLLLTRAVAVRRGRHQVQAYLDQLRADGAAIDDARNENWVSAAAAALAAKLLESLPAGRPRVFLAVRGTDALRFWKADRWVRLVEWLVRDRGCEIVLCGGPADARAHERLRGDVGPDVRAHLHDLSSAVPLRDTGGLVARMDLCIGVDTGLVHLAASFGVPVVVLVGPTDPNQWAPWMTRSEVVRSARVVRGLRDRLRARFGAASAAGLRWPLGQASMDDVGVAEVMDRVALLLPTTGPAPDSRKSESQAPLARHVSDCLGQADGPGGGGVSTCVPHLRRRHPAHRLHHGAGADPENPHASWRTARATTPLSRPWPADRLGRDCPSP